VTRRGIVLATIAALAVACEQPEATTLLDCPPITPGSPLSEVPTEVDSAVCIYYIDAHDRVVRVSPDGRLRETVLTSNASPMRQFVQRPPKGRALAALVAASTPHMRGEVCVDIAESLVVVNERDTHGQARMLGTDADPGFTFRLVYRDYKVLGFKDEKDNMPFEVELSKPDGTRATYRFRNGYLQWRRFFGMLDENHALILDRPDVVVWNIQSGEANTIAHSFGITVWARDLKQKERFKPVATPYNENFEVTFSNPNLVPWPVVETARRSPEVIP
jgi:hypothetical protein